MAEMYLPLVQKFLLDSFFFSMHIGWYIWYNRAINIPWILSNTLSGSKTFIFNVLNYKCCTCLHLTFGLFVILLLQCCAILQEQSRWGAVFSCAEVLLRPSNSRIESDLRFPLMWENWGLNLTASHGREGYWALGKVRDLPADVRQCMHSQEMCDSRWKCGRGESAVLPWPAPVATAAGKTAATRFSAGNQLWPMGTSAPCCGWHQDGKYSDMPAEIDSGRHKGCLCSPDAPVFLC